MVKITTELIIAEAKKRGWQAEVVDDKHSLVRYIDTTGTKHLALSTLTSQTTGLQLEITRGKHLLYTLAQQWGIPVPETLTFETFDEALHFLTKHGQIVVKPDDTSHGDGITTNVTDEASLKRAIEYAQTFGKDILLQQYLSGDDYRLLFIGGTLAAAAIRRPAFVVGDGSHSIQWLIEQENRSPDRGEDYTAELNTIDVRAVAQFLGDGVNRVPKKGEICQVVGVANIGAGGISVDATNNVPPAMLKHAQTIITKLGIPYCGVDFMYDQDKGPMLLEANAVAGFSMHVFPREGTPQPVAERFVDWLATTIDNDDAFA